MSEDTLTAMRDLIQQDVGNRGLRADPAENLITACADDFQAACRSLAETADPVVCVVTGFFIPHAEPPCAETDGPLGALFLARALVPLGMKVAIGTDTFCKNALEAGLAAAGLREAVPLFTLPPPTQPSDTYVKAAWPSALQGRGRFPPLTHFIAVERAGPSHTEASLRAQKGCDVRWIEVFLHDVPVEHHDRCHAMNGRDITMQMSPVHLLFEAAARQVPPVATIGIGDGGNEIGMGKIPWDLIRRQIPNGGLAACRVPTDYLIVCGVSNWGAYGLAAGVCLLRGLKPDAGLFDPDRERELLRVMVERGPLVDGVVGKPAVSVDGLSFERYVEPLRRLKELVG